MRIFKKYILFVLVPFVLASMAAEAAAPVGVKWTTHNLGVTGYGDFKADPTVPGNETEICVFCHTPHNAVPGKNFLWNRNESTATFYLYTASPTLNFTKTGITISDVSKMCMSCHDGGTALNSMANPRNVAWQGGIYGDEIGDTRYEEVGWATNIGEGVGDPDVAPGGNLTNDHPISFSYSQSQAADSTIKPMDGGGNSVGGGVLPLWGGKVECVTCHDPHINYNTIYPTADGSRGIYKPFLRKPNSSSSLCFTCHDK